METIDTEPEVKITIKRQRGENWLEKDKLILRKLVKQRLNDIENKKTDTHTNTRKKLAWYDLQKSFTVMASTPRTLKQLKAQWGIMKMNAKKKKYENRERGRGRPPTSDPMSSDDTAVWLDNDFSTDINDIDSDEDKHNSIKNENGDGINEDDNEDIDSVSKTSISSTAAAQRIANTEIACRQELHKAQLANEKQRLLNLRLEEELLRTQIIYYKSKIQ